jgi:hypothetical protein
MIKIKLLNPLNTPLHEGPHRPTTYDPSHSSLSLSLSLPRFHFPLFPFLFFFSPAGDRSDPSPSIASFVTPLPLALSLSSLSLPSFPFFSSDRTPSQRRKSLISKWRSLLPASQSTPDDKLLSYEHTVASPLTHELAAQHHPSTDLRSVSHLALKAHYPPSRPQQPLEISEDQAQQSRAKLPFNLAIEHLSASRGTSGPNHLPSLPPLLLLNRAQPPCLLTTLINSGIISLIFGCVG